MEAVIVRTLETTPRGATHWSTRALAKAPGLSHGTIARIWRAFGLQPHRTETFTLSPDPWLIEKVRDIVGLYPAGIRNTSPNGPEMGIQPQDHLPAEKRHP